MMLRAVSLVLIAIAGTGAQSGAPPPATVSGMVVTTDTTPQPIGGATVTITGGGLRSNLSAVTDEQGRFLVTNLPPGRYQVLASKPAYLTTAYGAARPGRSGASVAVIPGQSVELRIALARGAVVTGIVRDHLGEPAAGVQIAIGRPSNTPGGGTFLETLYTTDDRGIYRAFGLMPDEYQVWVLSRLSGFGDTFAPSREDVDAKLQRLEQRVPGARPAETPVAIVPLYGAGSRIDGGGEVIRLAAGE